ncbi:diguanylate cyclase [Candidatus Magnetominusculus dajiuhuensis]|uniref:sensor domain-containing diguanylate cyclase n=1 Tax=Candidatus Magnetominusculus dajiuhuensis TaxID=3137712 RepID=UPI003B4332D4
MIYRQVFDVLNLGLVILDEGLRVCYWNRWMTRHSGFDCENIIGSPLLEFFPDLDTKYFNRSVRSVFKFGSFVFMSQKLHKYLFKFEKKVSGFQHMQQSVTMGPIKDKDNVVEHVFIVIQDVTEMAAYERKLHDMNIKDGLTGVYNRRYLETRLKDEFDRHKRYCHALSVIMFDIDHFKSINDTFGHQYGDFVLKEVSATALDTLRVNDALARYGGEEFCCILPETTISSAMMVAERIRKNVESQENRFNATMTSAKVTISLGVSELCEITDTHEMLLKKADDALYKAKREGRNRVVSMTLF